MSAPDAADLAVDIVISNHNYAEFLGDAIESARSQTHPEVRVIVVDDGSTDGSRERLRDYEGEVEIVLKQNGGQASALNAGMERASGDVVIFLDADDSLEPDAARLAAHAFAADPRLAKVQFRMAVLDAAGRPTGVTKPNAYLGAPTGDMRASELAFPYDLPWAATSGNAFRESALRRILPIPEREYRLCADWYVVHLTTLLGDVASLEEVAANHRVHGRNNYEREHPQLDLERIRDTIGYAEATSGSLARLADELDMERPERILAVSEVANRLISLRLDPARHPLPGDTRRGVVADGLRAVRRRFDVSWPMKLAFVAWFLAVAVAPKPLVRRLAELFLFPERRASLNPVLGRLRRGRGEPAAEGA
jgi:glycosyltransferase involved in cell wall biosynthesis